MPTGGSNRATLLNSDIIDSGWSSSCELRVCGVSQAVRVRRGVTKAILSCIDGVFYPGNLTALMGPSGAGKTTLLTILRSGRCTAGAVTLNGQRYSRHTRRLIVTVPQDDVLLAGLTPDEMLTYAAYLVLPRAIGKAAIRARVHAVLSELNLVGDDKSTRIGSVDERGLSGGQRKRVSIGLEASPRRLLTQRRFSTQQHNVPLLHAVARPL